MMGLLKGISFQIWLFWVSMLVFGGVFQSKHLVFSPRNTNRFISPEIVTLRNENHPNQTCMIVLPKCSSSWGATAYFGAHKSFPDGKKIIIFLL